MLRSVRGGSAVDLDRRALTTEDDLIDLDELYPPDDDHTHSDDETARLEGPTDERFVSRRRAVLAVILAGAAVGAIVQLLPGSARGSPSVQRRLNFGGQRRRLGTADRRVRRAIGCHPHARDVADTPTPRCRAAGR